MYDIKHSKTMCKQVLLSLLEMTIVSLNCYYKWVMTLWTLLGFILLFS